jgi:hypothetical protein
MISRKTWRGNWSSYSRHVRDGCAKVARSGEGCSGCNSSVFKSGNVYECMPTEKEGEDSSSTRGEYGETEGSSRLDLLQRRMELAHKTYASYHVASLLTKRDFVLLGGKYLL